MTFVIWAAACTLLYLAIGFIGGLLVSKGKLPGYISRKITHITVYMVPFVARMFLFGPQRWRFGIALATLSFLRLFLCIRPLRERFAFSKIYFTNIERLEDGPYSLTLLFIQALSFSLIINVMLILNSPFLDSGYFHSIAIFVLAFGDGLAEPVGQFFGKYKYRVYSLFDTIANYRTLAGSSCVYITAFISICVFYPHTRPDFVFQLAFVPVLATALEAFSPRSVDNAILFFGTLLSLHLVGGLFG